MDALLAYKNRLLTEPVEIDIERAKLLTEVYREYEGCPALIKRAKFLDRLLGEKQIYIDENPIVGSIARRPNAVYTSPEFSCRWLRRELERGAFHDVGLGAPTIDSRDDREILLDTVTYWEDKCAFVRGCHLYNDKFRGEATVGELQRYGMWNELIWSFPQGSISPDYGKVLRVGLDGIIAEVEDRLAQTPMEMAYLPMTYFYEAALLSLKALVAYSRRLAVLAKQLADHESDPERKKQLLKIAECCNQVPAKPARNFREACQTLWFIWMACQVETPTSAIVLGRPGNYLYPFYQQDQASGKLTDEEAIELLGWTFLKCQGHGMFFSSSSQKSLGGITSVDITIGGLTPNGKPAVNALEHLILETQKRLQLTAPTLTLLWDEKLPEDFLLRCIDVIRTGIGQPMILNNAKMIEHFLNWYPQMTLGEARSGVNVGCIPTRPDHAHSNFYGGYPSMGKIMELVLYDGIDPISGLQLGVNTGDPESFQTFGELLHAVDAQIAHFVNRGLAGHRISACMFAEIIPLPLQSCFIDDCIQRGRDLQSGGARYSNNALLPVGAVDLANSLAAIKKWVYEEKRFGFKDLKKALEANFEGDGYDQIRVLCERAPKYGNDDEYADPLVEHCYAAFEREHLKHKDALGNTAHPESYSVTNHNSLGLRCGALPSGRKANLPFADATTSAYPGTDANGPTALLRSAAKVMNIGEWGSNHTNVKFHPSSMAGETGARNLLSLIKTYCELGGKHVQFNCVSREVLQDAQNRPEEYKDLVVRVAGFSAYFIHLDKTVQDEIIKRTELQFG